MKRYLEVYEEQKSLQDENNLHHKRTQARTKGIVGKEKVILVMDVLVVCCLSMHVLEFLKNNHAKLYIYFFLYISQIQFFLTVVIVQPPRRCYVTCNACACRWGGDEFDY